MLLGKVPTTRSVPTRSRKRRVLKNVKIHRVLKIRETGGRQNFSLIGKVLSGMFNAKRTG